MAAAVIEVNDSGVAVARDGRLLARSPGIAVVRDGSIELGENAARLAHTDPRNTYNRFWAELSQDELPGARGQVRHHADLAFAHLLALHERAGKPEQVLFAVPGSFTTGQLSLLLGLGAASPFAVTGLVDAAVAAAATAAGPGPCRHVDLHLHYAVVTALDVADYAERTDVSVVHGAGVLAIYDRCAGVIADQFIQQARLDPLRHAATEQALYDQLPVCLRDLQSRQEVVLEIRFEKMRYQARVNREQLVQGLETIYQRLAEALQGPGEALLSHRLALLPAFTDRVGRARPLGEMAVFEGCRQYQPDGDSEEGLSFITRLPAAAESVTVPVAAAVRTRPPAAVVTHVAAGASLYAVSERPLFVNPDGSLSAQRRSNSLGAVTAGSAGAVLQAESGVRAAINGRPAGGESPLRPGDTLTFEGTGATLLCVSEVNLHGTP